MNNKIKTLLNGKLSFMIYTETDCTYDSKEKANLRDDFPEIEEKFLECVIVTGETESNDEHDEVLNLQQK